MKTAHATTLWRPNALTKDSDIMGPNVLTSDDYDVALTLVVLAYCNAYFFVGKRTT